MKSDPFETPAPRLVTPRLTLRGARASDLDDLMAITSDPEVRRYIPHLQQSRRDVWHRLLRQAGQWVLQGFGGWMVVETSSGQIVGQIGFHDHQEPPLPLLDGLPEAGWLIASAAQGKGFAREAVAAALRWADQSLRGEGVFCKIDAQNTASLRLAINLRFLEVSRMFEDECELVVLLRERGG